MLLIRNARIRVPRALRGEQGGALVAVVGVAAVMMIFILTSSVVLVNSFRFSDTTRASVQAQASAQAGVAVVAADLTKSTCNPASYTRTSTPAYSVTISYQRTVSGTTWLAGCPSTAADVNKVKIVSVGTASTFTAVKRTVEAIYNYIPAVPGSGIQGSGSAIYGYNELDGTITNLTITQSGTSKPGIEFKSGNAKCQTGGVIQGDVILGDGAYNSPSGCTINGDLWTSQTVSVGNGSVISGSVHAAGTGSPVVSISNGASVQGSIYSAGPVSVAGAVGGNIIAGPQTGQSSVSAVVGGSFVSAGTLKLSGKGSITGSVTTGKSGIVAPVTPTVPNWVDFAYKASDWVDSSGTPFVEVKPTSCTGAAIQAAMTTAVSTIVNTLSSPCTGNQVNLTGTNLVLQADTVLIANSFYLKQMTISSATGTGTHRLWIITPDSVADQAPTCNAPAGASQIDNGVNFSQSVPVFVYAPCGLSNSGSEMWGQVYTSSIQFNNAFTLHYVSLGLPGVNFDNGTITPPTPPIPGKLSTSFSVRNISG